MMNPNQGTEIKQEHLNYGICAGTVTINIHINNSAISKITGNNNGNVNISGNKYSYLTEAFDKLTTSHRAKVLSLVEKLLKEQENQT